MRLSEFIANTSDRIISEWELFARSCLPAASSMDLERRRDHIAAMLKVLAIDLDTQQTEREQREKSKGNDDADVDSDTAASSHGTDRAAIGYTPVQIVAEFRALRASILRLWSEAQSELSRINLDEVTRFNESIDQLLAESIARYAHDVDHAKDLFLGVLGHDLRNPLAAIRALTKMLITKEGSAWPQLKTATGILLGVTRMDGMIGDLLDFTRSRLGAGIPIVREEIDLATICRHAVEEISAIDPRSVVRLETTGSLRGRWDQARIGQVLSNLLANARQHGWRHPIEVTLRGYPDEVVLAVHNKGPVIPNDRLKDIFTPFRRLDPSDGRPTSSLGLGLYIVEAVVTAHRGTVTVESTQHGTTFAVRLPRSAP